MPIAVADGGMFRVTANERSRGLLSSIHLGFHCSDMVMQAGVYEPTVAAVQNLGSGKRRTQVSRRNSALIDLFERLSVDKQVAYAVVYASPQCHSPGKRDLI